MKPQARGFLLRTGPDATTWPLAHEAGADGRTVTFQKEQGPCVGSRPRTETSLTGRFCCRYLLQTAGPGCDCCPVACWPLSSPWASQEGHFVIMGPLGNAPLPAVIPSVVAGCSCIDRPIPSNFLSDKGQKSNDKFADLLPREQRQAGGAPEIRGGWALESTGHPRCSQPWNHGEGVGGVGGRCLNPSLG